jgi:DNA phosphorothioation-dependent restriction protein DptH
MLKMVRAMRHRGMWVVYASQDPESVHPASIKLSSLIVAHQMKAKSSLKVLRECAAAFADVEPQELATLARGEALVLAGECAEPLYRLRPQKLRIRPTCARTSL